MKQIIYTAGGFHGTWRQEFNERFKDVFTILDPFKKEFNIVNKKSERLTFEEYTTWDLWAIRTADIVFVYSERTNPGQGYIVEAGYAKGLGKTVVLVREENNEHMPDKYLNFLDCIADFVTNDFNKGLNFLSKLAI